VKETVNVTVKIVDGWMRTIDGWAVKVIFAGLILWFDLCVRAYVSLCINDDR
jgi:hypothetical protein